MTKRGKSILLVIIASLIYMIISMVFIIACAVLKFIKSVIFYSE